MPVFEWQGADEFRDHEADRVIQPGEAVELREAVGGPHPEFVEVEAADPEGDGDELPDPSEYSVSEFFDEYSLEDFSDEARSELAAMEADEKDRESMLDRLTP